MSERPRSEAAMGAENSINNNEEMELLTSNLSFKEIDIVTEWLKNTFNNNECTTIVETMHVDYRIKTPDGTLWTFIEPGENIARQGGWPDDLQAIILKKTKKGKIEFAQDVYDHQKEGSEVGTDWWNIPKNRYVAEITLKDKDADENQVLEETQEYIDEQKDKIQKYKKKKKQISKK